MNQGDTNNTAPVKQDMLMTSHWERLVDNRVLRFGRLVVKLAIDQRNRKSENAIMD